METVAILVITLTLTALGMREFQCHRRRCASLAVRVHVNGTRGKSSVVRLIAAGLREGGIRTFAKCTGTSAMLVLPDGKEVPIHRTGLPTIMEQYDVASIAAERRHLAVLRGAATDRGTEMAVVGENEADAVTAEELAAFGYVEHRENVALALAVCEDVGVDRATALAGMQRARQDAGAMTVHKFRLDGKEVTLVNAFGANDTCSSEQAWRLALDRFPDVDRRIALMNCRADRSCRSREMGAICSSWPQVDDFFVIGTGISFFARAARRHGAIPSRIVEFPHARPDEVLRYVAGVPATDVLLVGIGNAQVAATILVGYLIGAAVNTFALPLLQSFAVGLGPYPTVFTQPDAEFVIIGHIIPGLIALELMRQGTLSAICMLLVGSAIVRLVLIVLVGTVF